MSLKSKSIIETRQKNNCYTRDGECIDNCIGINIKVCNKSRPQCETLFGRAVDWIKWDSQLDEAHGPF